MPSIRSRAASIAARSIKAHLRADAARGGRRHRGLGRREILDGQAERPEQGQLARVAAPVGRAREHLAELRADVLLASDLAFGSTASRNSPALWRNDSRLSQNSALAATVSVSSSRA